MKILVIKKHEFEVVKVDRTLLIKERIADILYGLSLTKIGATQIYPILNQLIYNLFKMWVNSSTKQMGVDFTAKSSLHS